MVWVKRERERVERLEVSSRSSSSSEEERRVLTRARRVGLREGLVEVMNW